VIAVEDLADHAAVGLVAQVVEEDLVHDALEVGQHLVTLGGRVDAVADPDKPDPPVHQTPPRFLGFDLVAREAREVVDEQDVEALQLSVGQHLPVARSPFGPVAARDPPILLPGYDDVAPPLPGGVGLAIPELIVDGRFALAFGRIPPV
jgi:hypothetical protein